MAQGQGGVRARVRVGSGSVSGLTVKAAVETVIAPHGTHGVLQYEHENAHKMGCCACTSIFARMFRCVQVTDAGFEEVARGCRRLEELRLYACSGVTDRALAEVGTLSSLRVRGSDGLATGPAHLSEATN